jgi:hypothetical protein
LLQRVDDYRGDGDVAFPGPGFHRADLTPAIGALSDMDLALLKIDTVPGQSAQLT